MQDTTHPSPSSTAGGNGIQVRVWDPFIRISHWLVAIGFAVAYITEGEPPMVHVWAGYTVAALVILRVVWGLVGSRHARFTDFVTGPKRVFGYLRDLAGFRSKRYIGHSPAGGAMTVALLLLLFATTMSGMATLADTANKGPLAPILGRDRPVATLSLPAMVSTARADDDEREERGERGGRYRSPFKEVHETLANVTLLFVILHLGGVVLASFAHRENLARAMVTGRKRAGD